MTILLALALAFALAPDSHGADPESLVRQGRFAEAAAIYAHRLSLPGLDPAEAALFEERLGNAHRLVGRNADAEPHLRRAATLAAETGQHLLLARSLHNLGSVVRLLGRREAAEASFRRALAILEAQNAPGSERAKVLTSLAKLHRDTRRFESARHLFEQSLTLLQSSPDALEHAWTLYELAELHYDLGNDDAAEKTYLHAAKLVPAEDVSGLPGLILGNRGRIAYRQGALKSAAAFWTQAIAFNDANPRYKDSLLSASSLANLGELRRQQKKWKDALALLSRAASLLERHPSADQFKLAQVLNLLGCTYGEMKRYPESAATLSRALALVEKTAGPHHPQAGIVLVNLGHFDLRLGRDRDAEEKFQRATAIFTRDSAQVSSHLVAAYLGHAAVLRKRDRAGEAADLEQKARQASAFLPGRNSVSVIGLREQ
jgi:tetratricopeptide (TPR) repeat protein